MSQKDEQRLEATDPTVPEYEAPRIEETARFESLTLTCTFGPGDLDCAGGETNS